MKIKNIITCAIAALTLCSSGYAGPVIDLNQNENFKQDAVKLTNLLNNKVSSSPSEDVSSPAMKLIEAIKNENFSAIEMYMESLGKFDINEQDELGYTALMWAIAMPRLGSVSRRLAYYSDITVKDRKGRNALMWAIKKKKWETVNEIINNLIYHEQYEEFNAQDEDGNTAMVYATWEHDNNAIERLLNITDAEGNYVVILNPLELKEYPKNGSYAVTHTLSKYDGGRILKMFIDARDKDGNYRVDLNYIDNAGYTLLSKASRLGFFENVKMLFNAKDDEGNYRLTNINSPHFEENPLMQAIAAGDITIMDYLLSARDKDGNLRINLDTKLDRNASYYLPNRTLVQLNEGDTILDIAIKSKQDNVIAYLVFVGTLRK